MSKTQRGLVCFFLIFVGCVSHLLAQPISQTADFEIFTPGPITTTNQLLGWTVLASQAASATPDPNDSHCNLPTCCWSYPTIRSELINAPNGYSDPTLGGFYKIYSIFGSSPSPSAASAANPQINFPMGGENFFRLNQSLGQGIDRLTTSFLVSDSTSFIDIAYISVINRAHTCCEDPGFRIEVDFATPCGTVLTNDCNNAQSVAGYFDALTGGPAGIIFQHIFNKWRVKRFDLTPFMGTTVTINVSAYSCVFGLGAHEGYAYIDARCGSSAIRFNGIPQITYQTKKTLISCDPTYTLSGPPYYSSYAWTGPSGFTSGSQSFTSSVSGVYTLTMSQENTCSSVTRTVEVLIVPTPTVTQSNTLCPGVTVTLTSNGALTYTWLNTNTGGNTLAVSPSITTTYTVNTTDTNGCHSTIIYPLVMNNTPNITITSPGSMCLGQTNTLSALGASSYTWYTSQQGVLSYMSHVTIVGAQVGQMTLAVLATHNTCTAEITTTIHINDLPLAVIKVDPSPTVCLGETITISGEGGISYHWITPESMTYSTSVIKYSPKQSGLIWLSVKDTNGCVGSVKQQLELFPKPETMLDGLTKDCVPFLALASLRIKPESKRVDWIVNGQMYPGPGFSHVFNEAGKYLVQAVHEDSLHGCKDTSSYHFEAFPKPSADFEFSPLKPYERDEIKFVNRSTTHSTECQWFFGDGGRKSTCERFLSYSYSEAGTYPLVLVVSNENNCRDTVIKALEILPEYFLYVPNAFTPNDDGKNEIFAPVARGVIKFTMEIFDRWGENIFVTHDLINGWDGFYKGNLCKTDIYVWKIILTNSSGEEKELSGHVSLQR